MIAKPRKGCVVMFWTDAGEEHVGVILSIHASGAVRLRDLDTLEERVQVRHASECQTGTLAACWDYPAPTE